MALGKIAGRQFRFVTAFGDQLEAGDLNAEAFTTTVTEAAAESRQRSGHGRITGFGGGQGGSQPVSESDLDALDDSVFGSVKEA